MTDDTGFAFSTTVIAYPKPKYVLLAEDGTMSNGVEHSLTVNAVNNFTVHLNKITVKGTDYGMYHLHINNTFGETIIYVSLIPKSELSIKFIMFYHLVIDVVLKDISNK